MSTSSWKSEPQSDQWNDGENWSSGQVPSTNAVFGVSSKTALTFAADSSAQIESLVFAEPADAFSFTVGGLGEEPALTITGEGIVNRSLNTQSFVVASLGTFNQPQLKFTGSASAGEGPVTFYAGPPSLETSYGGGTIAFHDDSTAGSAYFTLRTGKERPPQGSSLGGTVKFSERARAGTATFSIFGTLGSDGDTFANAVFHQAASAGSATFINRGGTVPGGDGGNTQFYDYSSAAQGTYINFGGTAVDANWNGANGGDVAFDGCATGGQGRFNNYPASIDGAHGGVTSFNNNPNYPDIENPGASAGEGTYINYGATKDCPGGGGHTEFTARYGLATAGNATILNFGSALNQSSGAGHTIFSIKPPNDYFPSAGSASIWNYPGQAGGYTIFQSSYGTGAPNQPPTAANAKIHNMGGETPDHEGGYTSFTDTASAGGATLIAYDGINGGQGGRVTFSGQSSGGTARIHLMGDGVLDITEHDGALTIGTLELTNGTLKSQLGENPTTLRMSEALKIKESPAKMVFSFPKGHSFDQGVAYPVLQAPNLADFDVTMFEANSIGTAKPTFVITGDVLSVSY
ncbi:hypothetical protein [Ruegeria lacuscaerulensis]|uniref:hypothetical protein n=1 Tax=Ruegeria lacuscaerulensis TaxID=55218 RepID=UPI00148020C3|nr:hypothetical protein [Ruegeria lacuscaerulensis]